MNLMRKILASTLTVLLLFTTPVFAGIFTDFDSYSSFNAGGNPVFNTGV